MTSETHCKVDRVMAAQIAESLPCRVRGQLRFGSKPGKSSVLLSSGCLSRGLASMDGKLTDLGRVVLELIGESEPVVDVCYRGRFGGETGGEFFAEEVRLSEEILRRDDRVGSGEVIRYTDDLGLTHDDALFATREDVFRYYVKIAEERAVRAAREVIKAYYAEIAGVILAGANDGIAMNWKKPTGIFEEAMDSIESRPSSKQSVGGGAAFDNGMRATHRAEPTKPA